MRYKAVKGAHRPVTESQRFGCFSKRSVLCYDSFPCVLHHVVCLGCSSKLKMIQLFWKSLTILHHFKNS